MLGRSFAEGILHFVFLTEEGVFTVGNDFRGALGVGDIERSNSIYNTIRKVINLDGRQVVGVGCCSTSTTFLTKDGIFFTCGGNEKGQLGTGDTKYRSEPTLVPFPYEHNIRDFCCSYYTVMVLTNTGKLFGWGCNASGNLGLGHTNSPQRIPIPIETLSSHKTTLISAPVWIVKIQFTWVQTLGSAVEKRTSFRSIEETVNFSVVFHIEPGEIVHTVLPKSSNDRTLKNRRNSNMITMSIIKSNPPPVPL